MRPMIKYRGGKVREIPYFLPYVPKEYNRYIEPFLGGGGFYFYLEPKKALVNDINPNLMKFYKDVRDNYELMHMQLFQVEQEYEANQECYNKLKNIHPNERVENKNEELFYKYRDMYNGKIKTDYLYGVLYYIINKTAYSGMIRFNSKGEYNVPFGRYQHLNTSYVTKSHSELLNRSEVYCTDYKDIFDMAKEDDFMFLDPPYDCTFHDYGNTAPNSFGEDDHRRLANDFKNLNCKALMVVGKTPLTEELYQGYICESYSKTYSVNIRNRFKNDAEHIIVKNY